MNTSRTVKENIIKSSSDELPMLVNPVTGINFAVAQNQQNIGSTVRPSATALLTIDSEDRFATQFSRRNATPTNLIYNWNPYDFQIIKNEALMNGFFTRLAVSEIVFPTAALPNINPKTDTINVLYTPNNVPPVIPIGIKLTDGFYTPARLASVIQAAVRAINVSLNAFTMTYGDLNIPAFRYSTNNTTTIAFAPNPENTIAYPYSAQTRQLFDILGMTYNTNTTQTAALTSTSITNCVDSRYYDIVCSQLTNNQCVKDSSSQKIVRDSLCRIYIADINAQNTIQPSDALYAPIGTAPTTIYRNFTTPKQIQWSPDQSVPGNIRIQVYDDDGNLLIPQNPGYGLDWSMTLQVSEN